MTRQTAYRVEVNGQPVGTWTVAEDARLSLSELAFLRNESCWCLDNMLEEGQLELSGDLPHVPDGHCLCTLVGTIVELVPVEAQP